MAMAAADKKAKEWCKKIWSKGELNPWPPECGSGALPTELLPRLRSTALYFFFTHFSSLKSPLLLGNGSCSLCNKIIDIGYGEWDISHINIQSSLLDNALVHPDQRLVQIVPLRFQAKRIVLQLPKYKCMLTGRRASAGRKKRSTATPASDLSSDCSKTP